MRRVALLVLGVLAATWIEFEFFPGHTYLQADTQLYVPMLERLDAPGYLSRDLVATHPDVAYTIYDEVTLFLHEAGRLRFRTALEGQQLFCRAAALTGVLLLALSAGVDDLLALLIATFLNMGAVLCGPAILLVDHEPVPRAFAFALILLAAGLLANEKPLLAGLAGGAALVYDPVIAAPFWGMAIISFVFDRPLRRPLRPALTILAIFTLLLANLAQLQPGVVESAGVLGKVALRQATVQQYRTPNVWVSLWTPADIWSYLTIYVCGVWATARVWPALNRTLRWILVGLPLCGILCMPASYLALERLRWYLIPQIQPLKTLLYTAAFSSLACGIAGTRAAMKQRRWEASLWFLPVVALPVNSRILDLLRVNRGNNLLELELCGALALALGFTLARARGKAWRYASLLIPLLAVFLIPQLPGSSPKRTDETQQALQLAEWAEDSTWGSSMFLFPDAGREGYPGTFRAASRRAVWVDWQSGSLVDRFESVASQWWERWQQTMQLQFSAERLQNMLALPVDYYVLRRSHQLETVRPVFQNRDFIVYDAADLRRSSTPLRLAANRLGS